MIINIKIYFNIDIYDLLKMEKIKRSDFKSEREYYLKIAEELEENRPFPPDAREFFFGIKYEDELENDNIFFIDNAYETYSISDDIESLIDYNSQTDENIKNYSSESDNDLEIEN